MPSRIGLMLDMTSRQLERVIYYEDYIVIDPGNTPLQRCQLLTENEYREAQDQYGESFAAGMGAEGIKLLLAQTDLAKLNVELDVPQSVVMVGGGGIPRKDPDFIPAYVLNHILGGGSFSSRLYKEVREERGLAYSVYSALSPLDHAALFVAGTATRSDRAAQALDVIQQEIAKMSKDGPTAQELAEAKSYLEGSFALRFDTSSKIASQLVQMQVDDLGIDYIIKRNSLIEAVTMEDMKRVSKRILDAPMFTVVVGRAPSAVAVGGAAGVPPAVPPAPPAKREGQ